MAIKPRRESDIVKNKTEDLKQAINDYTDYFNGESALPITFYQISDEASRTDDSLEDTHSNLGTTSSLKYNRIKNVPVYGLNSLDIQNQLTQRGMESFINGDFVIAPTLNLNPKIGEFFSFIDESSPELETHLFQITDVQYDRATSQKFYKCSFKLYPSDTDNIFSNIVKKYIYDPTGAGNHDGVGDSVFITEEESVAKDKILKLTDTLIETYKDLFYNDGMDTFTYQKTIENGTKFEYFWSPYICHFIFKNDLMTKSTVDFLTEIYVQDVNEVEFPNVYSEEAYRKSLFYTLETGDLNILKSNAIPGTFMDVSSYNLNEPLNLPFFSSAEKYYLLDLNTKYNKTFWLGAFNWVYDDEDTRYIDINGNYKYVGSLENYLITSGAIDSDGNVNQLSEIKLSDKNFYNISNTLTPFDITNIVFIPQDENSVPYQSDIYSILSSPTQSKDYLLNFIRLYLGNTLDINDAVISELQHYYYENNMKTFILLPIILFILKENA